MQSSYNYGLNVYSISTLLVKYKPWRFTCSETKNSETPNMTVSMMQ